MPQFHRVTRINVLTAIREHDAIGREEFREAFGVLDASPMVLIQRGKPYDAQALLAFAHQKAIGEEAAPTAEETIQVLRALDFRVGTAEEMTQAPTSRTQRQSRGQPAGQPRAARAAKAPARAERPVTLCPTCHTTLPVSGECDFCD